MEDDASENKNLRKSKALKKLRRLESKGFGKLVRTAGPEKKGCGCGKKAQFIYPKKRQVKFM